MMQISKQARGQPAYIDEEFSSAWRLSSTRKRQIDAQVADGSSREGACIQADFLFVSYLRGLKAEGKPITPEAAIETFGRYDSKKSRWSVWLSSQARAEHAKSLAKLGFSDEAADQQTDNDFRAHCSKYSQQEDTIQNDINSFENEQIRLAWKISEARERHIAVLLSVGFPSSMIDAQADLDFSRYIKHVGITRAAVDSKLEEFEPYHASIYEYSNWDENGSESTGKSASSSSTSDNVNLERMKPEILWRHLCELAELRPQNVIGRYDQTLDAKNEALASEVFLASLKRHFKATSVTDTTVDRAMKGFLKDIGI